MKRPLHRYRNPWHSSDHGPEFYTTEATPAEYRGFQIFHRHEGIWELVKDGVCLTQRAGKNGPRNLADALLGDKSDDQPWLVEQAREIAAKHGVEFDVSPNLRRRGSEHALKCEGGVSDVQQQASPAGFGGVSSTKGSAAPHC